MPRAYAIAALIVCAAIFVLGVLNQAGISGEGELARLSAVILGGVAVAVIVAGLLGKGGSE